MRFSDKNRKLASSLESAAQQMSNYSKNYLERMEGDSQLKLKDFLPYFGKGIYENRNLQHRFASLFSENSEVEKSINSIKKRGKILKTYNDVLRIAAVNGLLFGLFYWIKA